MYSLENITHFFNGLPHCCAIHSSSRADEMVGALYYSSQASASGVSNEMLRAVGLYFVH